MSGLTHEVLRLEYDRGLLTLVIGLATAAATASGGALALRFRSALGLFLGFSSGAIIGVALFDLLPEAFALGNSHFRPFAITTAVAVGFVFYLALDRTALAIGAKHRAGWGNLGPSTLTAHSLMDGLGIGLGFQVSSSVGGIMALAVLAHDMIDGANVVTLSLASGASPATARRWLIADALAPLVGIVAASSMTVPADQLALLLAIFSGFFLYIGASDLLPRSQASGLGLLTLAAMVLGIALIYSAVRLAAA